MRRKQILAIEGVMPNAGRDAASFPYVLFGRWKLRRLPPRNGLGIRWQATSIATGKSVTEPTVLDLSNRLKGI